MITLAPFINNCRSPRLINMRGVSTIVRCGKCPDCCSSRSNYYTKMIEQAVKNHTYTYFLTLTYDEFNVPKVILKDTYNQISSHDLPDEEISICGFDITRRRLADKVIPPAPTKGRPTAIHIPRYKVLSEHNQPIFNIPNCNTCDDLFNKFYKKSKILPKNASSKLVEFYNTNYILRYLRKKDAQDFIKRLRFYISKDTDSQISFYIVGEYGPITFRPHYHVLLFFNDRNILENIERYLNSSWKFGNIKDSGLARDTSKCCSYVASYCNSYSHLPRYLSSKNIAPFQIHSHYLGSEINSELRNWLYDDVRRALEESDVQFSQGLYHFSPTRECTSQIFPRCYNYVNLYDSERYELYTCFDSLYKKYNTTKVSDIVKYILINQSDYLSKRLLELLQINPSIKSSPYLVLNSPDYYSTLYSDTSLEPTEYDLTLYYRIYSAIHLSKHFINFCCAHQPPQHILKLINSFYNLRDIHLIKKQHESIFEYYKKYTYINPFLFYPIIGNQVISYFLPFFQKHPRFSKQINSEHLYKLYNSYLSKNPRNHSIFHFHKYVSDNSDLIKSIYNYRDTLYSQRVKHKELNDANLIFV